jgi:glycosyltransferase involved in cell wall biosynthesis
MATHNPEPGLFEAQIESIRAQTHANWRCVVSDDASDPARLREIEAVLAGDDRFALHRNRDRAGFYRNFERAISHADPAASFVALADHDDRWYPDKLEALLEALDSSGARLAYSDARAVEADGTVIRASMWGDGERPNQWSDLATMLIANTVTGAASLMRREVASTALPFPALPGKPYHDHWLALVALAGGDLTYVDRPLYDWVRHGTSVVVGETELLRPADYGRLEFPPKLAEWRRDEGNDLRRLEIICAELERRLGDAIPPAKRRSLRRVARADSIGGVAWLWWRWLRSRLGSSSSLGRELLLLRGVGARRLDRLRGGRSGHS